MGRAPWQETGRELRRIFSINAQLTPGKNLYPIPIHEFTVPPRKIPDWAYYPDEETLVFPVCRVGTCGNQKIISKNTIHKGQMVMNTSMQETDATDILLLHLEEKHGIKQVTDISRYGYLLPRRFWVK